MDKKWVVRKSNGIDGNSKIHPVICNIISSRGINDMNEAFEFLSERPQVTYDPFLLKDMEEAVTLILRHVSQNSKICIYGDYDTDGITSVSLLIEVLGNLTDNIMYYLPSRFDEGYGLSNEAIDKIYIENADLIITVDCGSVSVDEVKYAKSLGMDIIVSDHHSIAEERPDCLLINPKQEDCKYPFKDLCGCGVAFKIAQAIQRRSELPKSVINQCLDLVAIATIGDIVPLCSENRTLTKYGMNIIKKGQRLGLAILMEKIGVNRNEITSEQMGYKIVPHINAAGRMDYAGFCVELLTSNDRHKIENYVTQLIEKNEMRKLIQEETFRECCDMVDRKYGDDKFILIDAKNAHEGVTGIVAGKIKDKYDRPTAIVTESKDGLLKGTARSIETVNLYDLLSKYSHLYEKFGGHSGACGFSLKEENLNLLRRSLNEELRRKNESNPDIFVKWLKIDAEVTLPELNLKFCDLVDSLGPFGYKNEKPIFVVRNTYINNYNYIGEEARHVRFNIDIPGAGTVGCILFQRANEYKDIMHKGLRIDVAGYVEKNKFNGRSNVQIKVIDIRESGEELGVAYED